MLLNSCRRHIVLLFLFNKAFLHELDPSANRLSISLSTCICSGILLLILNLRSFGQVLVSWSRSRRQIMMGSNVSGVQVLLTREFTFRFSGATDLDRGL